MAKKYWKLKIIKRTKTHIWLDVTPVLKGKKKIPKYLGFKNLEDIEAVC